MHERRWKARRMFFDSCEHRTERSRYQKRVKHCLLRRYGFHPTTHVIPQDCNIGGGSLIFPYHESTGRSCEVGRRWKMSEVLVTSRSPLTAVY